MDIKKLKHQISCVMPILAANLSAARASRSLVAMLS